MAAAGWNSFPLWVVYQVLGWSAFAAWSCSFYPQVILNFRRKSVVGLNFDFVVLNLIKHTSYLIYNTCMYFIPIVQYQYHLKYGFSELIPVALSDVAFSVHAVLLTWITAYQVFIYEKGNQRLSTVAAGISGSALFAIAICLVVAWPQGRWLWLVSAFNVIQVAMTLVKYVPQAWMNYQRKSTVGWSIGNILLDLTGGIGNFLQMGVQSIDQGLFWDPLFACTKKCFAVLWHDKFARVAGGLVVIKVGEYKWAFLTVGLWEEVIELPTINLVLGLSWHFAFI